MLAVITTLKTISACARELAIASAESVLIAYFPSLVVELGISGATATAGPIGDFLDRALVGMQASRWWG